jgi:hypothetical protein
VLCSEWHPPIDYHEAIPHSKGIYIVKMSPRWLAVALLLTTFSVPGTLMATTGSGPDGNPSGPPPIVYPSPVPTDGNPSGPPPVRPERIVPR